MLEDLIAVMLQSSNVEKRLEGQKTCLFKMMFLIFTPAISQSKKLWDVYFKKVN